MIICDIGSAAEHGLVRARPVASATRINDLANISILQGEWIGHGATVITPQLRWLSPTVALYLSRNDLIPKHLESRMGIGGSDVSALEFSEASWVISFVS